MENTSELMEKLEEHMLKTEEALQHQFIAIRTGKASPALVENIMVEYYGTPTRLKELAGITTPAPRLASFQARPDCATLRPRAARQAYSATTP